MKLFKWLTLDCVCQKKTTTHKPESICRNKTPSEAEDRSRKRRPAAELSFARSRARAQTPFDSRASLRPAHSILDIAPKGFKFTKTLLFCADDRVCFPDCSPPSGWLQQRQQENPSGGDDFIRQRRPDRRRLSLTSDVFWEAATAGVQIMLTRGGGGGVAIHKGGEAAEQAWLNFLAPPG